MEFDTNYLRKISENDYEKAWVESGKLLTLKGRGIDWKTEKGIPNNVVELVNKFRRILLNLGFEEVINPSIISEEEVYKQYGPEAMLILDRCFYLAGLPRADIGISDDRKAKIQEVANIDIAVLMQLLRAYKEGRIEADNLVDEMIQRLNIRTEEAGLILSMFKEFKELLPVPTKLTLRSHMTALWFPTIEALMEKRVLPLKLFSIGNKFRREQKQDALHLYESLTASLIAVAENITLEDGKALAKKILSKIGFKKITFTIKKATSKYYAPDTEFEIFVDHNGKKIEIGDGGLYSPVSLAKYDIRYPVFNVGFGVERILMLMKDIEDIRVLIYPQFYAPRSFSDEEIAQNIRFDEKPKTVWGQELAQTIAEAILKYKDEIGPKKIQVYKGEERVVYLSEPEANRKLLGPAGLNVVYVYDGNIMGINPTDSRFEKIVQNGVRVCDYIQAISNRFAATAENKNYGKYTLKMVDTLPSLNLTIDKAIWKFITSQSKRIDVKGAIFVDMEIEEISRRKIDLNEERGKS